MVRILGYLQKSENTQFYSFTHPDRCSKLLTHVRVVVAGVNGFWRPVIIYKIRCRFCLCPKPRHILRAATKLESMTFGK
jgi:hypothetical protein